MNFFHDESYIGDPALNLDPQIKYNVLQIMQRHLHCNLSGTSHKILLYNCSISAASKQQSFMRNLVQSLGSLKWYDQNVPLPCHAYSSSRIPLIYIPMISFNDQCFYKRGRDTVNTRV